MALLHYFANERVPMERDVTEMRFTVGVLAAAGVALTPPTHADVRRALLFYRRKQLI